MCWSRKEIVELISLWELLPELWDVKSKGYRNEIKKQNAIKSLALDLVTSECKITRKFHTPFHQEIGKSETRASGSDTDEIYITHRSDFDLSKANDSTIKNKKRKHNSEKQEDYDLQKVMKILERPADDYQIFGDFVAAELRRLKSPEKERLLKQKIQRAILDVSESEDVPSVLS
ncbi:hypothetical protein MML48_7g00011611 [Holotrichia oblita]|uniref:Uncharacterized protein n=1 Tax=Holotrichia oblita TaxID=644536 RepID=A0ACB9SW93_HOLOL|nr:hypothetical protein MML48_7g00011611 [Holotrichia oblita]